ncbi:MAG TPA: glycosyltransferase family 39 protein, partial [Oceanobacillus sp.]|nr:glycosyltransferase family 39 protein [Oceanobacillus sp.]
MSTNVGAAYESPFTRYHWLALAILLTGFAIRILLHDYHGLEGDDAYSLSLSRLPVETLVPGLMAFQLDIHPPLHFLLVKGWAGMAGESLLSLRLLNILMDLGIGALLIRLAGRAFSRRSGLVAGVLWVISPLLLASDLLVRMYTLLALLGTAGFVIVIEAERAYGGRRSLLYILLGVCALAAMYTHMLGFVLTAVFAVGVTANILTRFANRSDGDRGKANNSPSPRLRGREGRGVRGILFPFLPLVLAAILSLPYAQSLWALYRSGRPLGAEINPLGAFSTVQIPDVILSTLLTGRAWIVIPFLLTALIVLCIVWVFLRYRARAFVVMLSVSILAMIALAWFADLYKPRYLAPFVPPLLALLAGVVMLPRRALLRGILFVGLALISGAAIIADFDRTLRDDWVAAAQFVQDHEQLEDTVIVIPDWGGEAFRYHYQGDSSVTSLLPGVSPEVDLDSLLTPLVENRDRVWFVWYQPLVSDPQALADAWFRARAVTMTEVFSSGIQVKLYDFDPVLETLPQTAQPLDAVFGDMLALRGVFMPITQGSARDTRLHPPSTWVYVELYWESLQAEINVIPRVRLTDSIGQVYGGAIQRDTDLLANYPLASWLPGQIIRAAYDLNLNPDTPPGTYNIEVMVLDPASGEPLPASGANAGQN